MMVVIMVMVTMVTMVMWVVMGVMLLLLLMMLVIMMIMMGDDVDDDGDVGVDDDCKHVGRSVSMCRACARRILVERWLGMDVERWVFKM